MVESFNHDDIQASSFDNKEGAGSQLSDMLRNEFLEQPGERRNAAGQSRSESVLTFGAEQAEKATSRSAGKDGTNDFLQASLDAAFKRSNIAVGSNGKWSLE